MNNWKNTDLGLLILRITFGGFMIFGHGWGKFMRFFGEEPIKFRNVFGMGPEWSLGMATFAELLCAFLIMIGLFTRYSVIPLIITMAVAFSVHLADPFSRQEKALLYLFAFIALLFTGPGKYALDEVWRKGKF